MSDQYGGSQPPPEQDERTALTPQIRTTPQPPTVGDAVDDEDEGMLRMSFLEHLEELRSRLISMLVGGGVAFALSMFLAPYIWTWVKGPLQFAVDQVKGEIIAISPMEQFTIIYMWVPLVAAIYVSAPWILWQVWSFIAPGLYPRERRWAGPFILITAGLFVAGGAFAYYIALPLALRFLLAIGQDVGVKASITIDNYFSLFVNAILGVSVLFELPVVVFFLTLLRITTPGFLIRNSRYAILAIVVLAAVVTPTPDPVNLALFSVPMILLFFLGVFASYLLVLHREGQKFPWRAFFIWVGSIVALIAAGVAIAVLYYGFKLVPHWPFLTK